MSTNLNVKPNIRSAISDDGGVLLDLNKGSCYSLNVVGAEVWARLEEGLSFEEIVDYLSSKWDVPYLDLKSDLETFVVRLRKKTLVCVNS